MISFNDATSEEIVDGRARAIDGTDIDTTITCDIGAIEYIDVLLKDSFE